MVILQYRVQEDGMQPTDDFYFQVGDLIVLDDLSSTERWEVTGVWKIWNSIRFEIKSMVTGNIVSFQSKGWLIAEYKFIFNPVEYLKKGEKQRDFYLVKASDRRWEKSLWDPKELKELQNALNG